MKMALSYAKSASRNLLNKEESNERSRISLFRGNKRDRAVHGVSDHVPEGRVWAELDA